MFQAVKSALRFCMCNRRYKTSRQGKADTWYWLAALLLTSATSATPTATYAQSITPATDGTGTNVRQEGNRYDITGGKHSGDRANLFHSFDRLGLDAGEIANFQVIPEIQNIVGRVVGGDASVINGLIQITGGNSNLFLMNPAGIVFGSNATLNVPADFFATTATGIGFGNHWFNAIGTNDWANLVGTPSEFAFSLTQPGAIANFGNLALQPGHDLTLLGGSVLNAGTLSSPGGNITIVAVPGESTVRISQDHHLLSLDIANGAWGIGHGASGMEMPRSLPELLTGGGLSHASKVQVNPDGTISLTGSGMRVQPKTGDAIASGAIDVSSPEVSRSESSRLHGGQITVLGDRVSLLNANLNASGANGGGTVLIGGDFQGNGSIPNARYTFVSHDSIVRADALIRGDGGRAIVWSDEVTQFFGQISARGGATPASDPASAIATPANGGFVEISGKTQLEFAGIVDTRSPHGKPGTLLLDPKNIVIRSGGRDLMTGDLLFAESASGTSRIAGSNLSSATNTTSVILQANNDIIIDDDVTVTTPGNGLTLQAGRSIIFNPNRVVSFTGGDFTAKINDENALASDRDRGSAQFVMNSGSQILTNGGNVTIEPGTFGSIKVGEVHLNGAIVNAGSGNIAIAGTGINTSLNRGITIENGSELLSIETGSITLSGNGGGGTDNGRGIEISGDNTRITSEDGNITLYGMGKGRATANEGVTIDDAAIESTGTGTLTVTGVGGAGTSNNSGLYITGPNAHLTSGDGDINVTGTGGAASADNNIGIHVTAGATIHSTGTGAVAFKGTGGTGISNNDGIEISGTNTRISSVDGEIDLSGSGNGTGMENRGIDVDDGAAIESTGIGPIILRGDSAFPPAPQDVAGIRVRDSFINPSGTGSGTITAIADEIDLLGTTEIKGTGVIQFEPLTETLGITIGGTTNDERLNLEDRELATLQEGLAAVVIGGESSSGAIALTGDTTFNQSIVLRSPMGTGTIGTTNYTLSVTDDASITLNAKQAISTGNLSTAGGDITIATAGTATISGSVQTNGGNFMATIDDRLTPPETDPGQFFMSSGSEILTAGGNISIRHETASSVASGAVRLDNGRIDSGTGNIAIAATESHGGNGKIGIVLENNSVVQASGAGTITLSGKGGTSSDGNEGIQVSTGSRIASEDGHIAISGIGGGGTQRNRGLSLVSGSAVEVTGAGNIALEGTGGKGSEGNVGIFMDGNARISATDGNITLSGIGGSGTRLNRGIQISNDSRIVTTGVGNITGSGRGGNGTGTDNAGIAIDRGSAIAAQGTGTIVLNGTGGTGTNANVGIAIADSNTRVTTAAGNIEFRGSSGGTGNQNDGIRVTNGSRIEAFTTGKITLEGTGGNGVSRNRGIAIADPNTRIGSVNGAIALSGTGGNGTGENNPGIDIKDSVVETRGTGNIALEGTGGTGTQFNVGIAIAGANARIESSNGSIAVTGTAGAGTQAGNSGIVVDTGGRVRSTGRGNITLEGTGGTGTNDNIGVSIRGTNSQVSAVEGNLQVTGTGGNASGSGNSGVELWNGGAIATTGRGNITLEGIGGNNTDRDRGIRIAESGSAVRSRDGNITLTGEGSNISIELLNGGVVESTGIGNLRLMGQFSSPRSVGIQLDNASINPTGTGSGTVTLEADEIHLLGSSQLRGMGDLVLRSRSPDIPVAIGVESFGGGTTAGLDLTTEEMSRLQDGFRSIAIGHSNGSARITTGDFSVTDPLFLNAPFGAIAIEGQITATDNATVEIAAPSISLDGAIATENQDIAIAGKVQLRGDSTLDTRSGAGNISFTSTVDGLYSLNLASGIGEVNFSNAVGSVTPLSNLSVNSAARVNLNGGINLADTDLNFTMPVNLTGSSIFHVGNGRINFGSILTANQHHVSLTATEIEFGDSVSGSGTIALQPSFADGEIRLGGNTNPTTELHISSTELAELQDGFRQIAIGRSDGTGTIAIDESGVTFKDPVTLRSPQSRGSLIQNGEINLQGNASLTLQTQQTHLNANITSTGNPVDLGTGKIAIADDLAIATNGGNITAAGTIDGSGNLTLNAGSGNVLLRGNIGETTRLSGLEINAATAEPPAEIAVGAEGLTLNADIFLSDDTEFDAGTGTIAFGRTVNADSVGNPALSHNLTLTADEINFNGGQNSVKGRGTLVLQPSTANLAIDIANEAEGMATSLEITRKDLDALQNGFQEIIIGRKDGNGAIAIAPVEFEDSMTLRSPQVGGSMTVEGEIGLLDNATLTCQIAGQTVCQKPKPADPNPEPSLEPSDILEKEPAIANPETVSTQPAQTPPGEEKEIPPEVRSQEESGESQVQKIERANPERTEEEIANPDPVTSTRSQPSASAIAIPIYQDGTFSISEPGDGSGETVEETATAAQTNASPIFSEDASTTHIENSESIAVEYPPIPEIPLPEQITSDREIEDEPIQETTEAEESSDRNSGSATQSSPQQPIPQPIRPIRPTNQNQPASSTPPAIEVPPPVNVTNLLEEGNIIEVVPQIEELRLREFTEYYGQQFAEGPRNAQSIQDTLGTIARETGTKPALIYILIQRDRVEAILLTGDDTPIRKIVPDANGEQVRQAAKELRQLLTDPRWRNSDRYLPNAQQLYKWLIAPLEPELEAKKIETLIFSMDTGLRSVPIAALYDGKQFLVEKYSLALIPSITLTDTRYRSMQNTRVLAMGASEFKFHPSLPAVPVELSTITEKLWPGKAFLNEEFTRENLEAQRREYPYQIVHLATHAEFMPGVNSNSYIQLWDRRLLLSQLRELRWNNPQVELLVLSACRTALGDTTSELGFAGFAVQAGVKSALASLWYVSDEGTLGLMTEFYQHLATAPIKAEALRQAQIAMLSGQVKIENGQLQIAGSSYGQKSNTRTISLPPELADLENMELSHPYYWAAFTMIGSPW